MAYSFTSFDHRVVAILEWFNHETAALRTGRATPVLLDHVMVESYGSLTPLKHVAAISIEDARTLRISPWDHSQIKAIESAVAASNLGVNAVADGQGLRLNFPPLTEERRKLLVKTLGSKLEEAKISLRQEREKVLSDLSAKRKGNDISEDEERRSKTELQKKVDEGNSKLEASADKREQEILTEWPSLSF